MRTRLLVLLGLVFSGPLEQDSITSLYAQVIELNVDTTITYQTIEGWGGHVYPQTLSYFDADSSYERHMLRDLHTTHIRLRSVWYLLEAENDNDDPFTIDFDAIASADTGLVHDELLLQQRLTDRGIKLLFASWRFPYWMAGMPPDWNPGPDEKPDLPHDMDDEYVESVLAYLLYARDRYGIVFDAISVANEPDIAIYIGGLTPERLFALSSKLGDALEEAGYRTRFYLPDVAAADSIGRAYSGAFFEIPGARDFSSAVAYHSYRRERDVVDYFGKLGRTLNLPVWVTEQSHTHLAVEDRFEWSHALKNAVCLHDVLVDGNASISLYWSYAMSSSRGLGLYIPESKSWAPAYDMLKHFYNFIPTGSQRVRVGQPPDEDLRVSAYLAPVGTTNSVTLVIVHTGSSTVQVRPSVSGMDFIKDVTVSTAERRWYLEAAEQDGVITVSPESVVTVVIGLNESERK